MSSLWLQKLHKHLRLPFFLTSAEGVCSQPDILRKSKLLIRHAKAIFQNMRLHLMADFDVLVGKSASGAAYSAGTITQSYSSIFSLSGQTKSHSMFIRYSVS